MSGWNLKGQNHWSLGPKITMTKWLLQTNRWPWLKISKRHKYKSIDKLKIQSFWKYCLENMIVKWIFAPNPKWSILICVLYLQLMLPSLVQLQCFTVSKRFNTNESSILVYRFAKDAFSKNNSSKPFPEFGQKIKINPFQKGGS